MLWVLKNDYVYRFSYRHLGDWNNLGFGCGEMESVGGFHGGCVGIHCSCLRRTRCPDQARSEANCTSELKVLECTIEGLEPSTNYTITVAVFKRLQDNFSTLQAVLNMCIFMG